MVIPHDLIGWFPPPFLLSLNHKIPNVIVPTFHYLAFSDLVLSNRFGNLGGLICGIAGFLQKGKSYMKSWFMNLIKVGGRENSLRHSLCWGPPETYWNPQRSVWRPLAWSSSLITKMVNIYEAYTVPIRYKHIDKCHSFDFLTVLWR